MRYVAIIFGENPDIPVDRHRDRKRFADYVKFIDEAREAGVLVSAETLQSTDTATVVKAMDRGIVITDGPFMEAGEPVHGFYMLECENLDQAIEWAAKIPQARAGAIEVRPALDADM